MEAQEYRPCEKDEDELVVEGNKVGLKTALDDDPNAPKEDKSFPNYQTKVTDPTGANREEAVSSPLVESLEKMSIKEETKAEKSKSSDKGVSMKGYITEKFKPRDEDKALSEVISGKLSGRKDKTQETEQTKPTEKATQKGSADEQRAAAAAMPTHVEGAGKSMIDRLKGTASSWFRKGDAKPPTAAAAEETPTSTTHGT
ncbi:low-temperature-induced 65 kDa protein-like [Solanum dulcamara]|uniref:low-temperature-induced 65 kDa protein-like n=1 Tax=Solanum dulcamara TaxID=45834 RepID=UPI0024858A5F|nr:low-temperature-induced 65 kDa protein-like [Solanum dulcamara]